MAAPPAQVTRLDTIFRQGETSGIIRTAHAILNGESHPGKTITSLRDLDPTDDFTFIEAEDAVQCAKAITYLAREYIPKTHHIDPIKDLQILSPMHRGSAGIAALNTALQESLNDTGKALSGFGQTQITSQQDNPTFAKQHANHCRLNSPTERPPTASAIK